MKPKNLKILYWIVAILFCLANLFSGISGFFPNQKGLDIMAALGYPVYLLVIIGVAKVLGSVAILQTKFKTIKEWAYAGFTIDYLGAASSFYITGNGVAGIVTPLVFLIVLFMSYFLWKRVGKIKA